MAAKPHPHRVTLPGRLIRGLCLSLLYTLLYLQPLIAQGETRHIEIHHADANEVALALDGLVESGGSLRVYQNQLIIEASPANIAELAAIIEVLDEAPRGLLISFKSPTQAVVNNGVFKVTRRGRTYRSDGEGNTHTLRNPDGTITQTRVRLSESTRGGTTLNGSGSAQTIRALEGRDALLRFSSLGSGYGASQGLYANARVQGNRVTITIQTHSGSYTGGQHGSLEAKTSSTQVSGRLGQWIPAGSITVANQGRSTTNASHAWDTHSTAQPIYLKVELATN